MLEQIKGTSKEERISTASKNVGSVVVTATKMLRFFPKQPILKMFYNEVITLKSSIYNLDLIY